LSAWSNEKAAISYYITQLSLIQSQVRLIEFDPSSNDYRRESTVQTLLQYTVNLETIPTARTYVVSKITAENIPGMRRQLLQIRDEHTPRPSPTPTPVPGPLRTDSSGPRPTPTVIPANADRQSLTGGLEAIDQLCSQLQQQINAISFSTFAMAYYSANSLSFWIGAIPITLFAYLFVGRAYRDRLLRHRRLG
jgi:hypothetical protein